MTDSSPSIIVEEALPFEVTEGQALSVLKQRIKNPDWTIGFALSSDYVGMLKLGELFHCQGLGLEPEMLEVAMYSDVMVAFCLPTDGYMEPHVDNVVGEQPDIKVLRQFPAKTEGFTRLIIAHGDAMTTLFTVFFNSVLKAEEVN